MSTSVAELRQRIVLRKDREGEAIILCWVNGSKCGGQTSGATLDRESASVKRLRQPTTRHFLTIGYFGVIVHPQSKIPQLSFQLVDSMPNTI